MPNSFGIEGPNRSASSTPTLRPSLARPTARLQATVDLPTPPLPDATAMMCLTPGMGAVERRRAAAAAVAAAVRMAAGRARPPPISRAASAVRVTTALVTPGAALIAASALARIGSSALALSGSTTMARKTLPSRMVRPEMAPESGSGVLPSGPGTPASAAITSSRDAILSLPPARRARCLGAGPLDRQFAG